MLNFTFMDTECTYDYLFVYDGDSYQSPLLASLSGNTLPQPVEAKSGKVTDQDATASAVRSINSMTAIQCSGSRCCYISSATPITTSWASMRLTPSPRALAPVAAMAAVIPPRPNVFAIRVGEDQVVQPPCAPRLVL